MLEEALRAAQGHGQHAEHGDKHGSHGYRAANVARLAFPVPKMQRRRLLLSRRSFVRMLSSQRSQAQDHTRRPAAKPRSLIFLYSSLGLALDLGACLGSEWLTACKQPVLR